MIVRCTSCVSAFAVDDEKVANRKFAFTCPKCGTENIFDNRKHEEIPASREMFFEEEAQEEIKEPSAGERTFEHDLGSEEAFFDEAPETPDRKGAGGLNLELEETSSSEEEITFDDDFFAEETPSKKAVPAEEEILFDEDELLAEETPPKKAAPAEEEILFDEDELLAEETPSKKAVPAEEEILFDEDELLAEETPSKKVAPAEEEILFDEDEFIIDESETPEDVKKERKAEEELLDMGLELEVEAPGTEAGDRDVKVSSQDDIDAMFADLPSEEDIPAVQKAKKGKSPEDEITVDLDELDIELEGDITSPEDEFIAFEDTGEIPDNGRHKAEEPLFDDDITIDMDSLDIDIDEAGDFHRPSKLKEEIPGTGKAGEEEEELVLTIDEFEDEFEAEGKGDLEVTAGKKTTKEIPPEDDITLDLDSLDIELDEGEVQIPAEKAARGEKKISAEAIEEFAEEDLKLSLDEMDVDIEELEKKEPVFEDEIFVEQEARPKKKPVIIEETEEDESITIDLETLDIDVAETPEVMTGEMTEEEEKLTLDDAGLTFSELAVEEERKPEPAEAEEEELFLSLDEIDPDLKLQVIGEEAPKGERPLSETVEELPEIDLDQYEEVIRKDEFKPGKETFETLEGFEEFETLDIPVPRHRAMDLDILEYEEEGEESYTPERGSTTFSIDYSLKYSRLGAFLRLIGLYILSMIPHLIVMLIYTILSGMLGFINQIVILSTGRCVEDFSLITENTLRYFLYIKSNITGIVEDRPVYAGRENISHQMQLNITFPVKYSKNLAMLRLSIIGIWLITLPHFIIMSMLTLAVPFVYLAGIITVIITRRWPNPLFIFLTRYFRYLARISSFLLGLTDEYPPFRFD